MNTDMLYSNEKTRHSVDPVNGVSEPIVLYSDEEMSCRSSSITPLDSAFNVKRHLSFYCPEGAFCVGRAKKIDVRTSVRPSVRPSVRVRICVTLDLPEISKFVAKYNW